MSWIVEVDLLVLLVLFALDAAFGALAGGPFVVLWSFVERVAAWLEKSTWSIKGPWVTSGKPCRSRKGLKDQKDHARNTGSHEQ